MINIELLDKYNFEEKSCFIVPGDTTKYTVYEKYINYDNIFITVIFIENSMLKNMQSNITIKDKNEVYHKILDFDIYNFNEYMRKNNWKFRFEI